MLMRRAVEVCVWSDSIALRGKDKQKHLNVCKDYTNIGLDVDAILYGGMIMQRELEYMLKKTCNTVDV